MTPHQVQNSPGHKLEFIPRGPAHQGTELGPAAIEGLYFHIPFCFHKCHYCDFYSIVDQRDRQRWFTDALIGELTRQADRWPLRPGTIFVGGGTPTLLETGLWQRLLETMHQLGVLERVTEFTVEANPETVTDELLATLAAGGVNRLSIGAQSFDPALLKTLERWHEPASVQRAVTAARAAGITDVNLDLIFAIPGQTMAGLDRDLEARLALQPTHLACYSLIFEPETPLAEKKRQGRIQPVAEQQEAAMYERVIDRLDAAGFEHYEISNWAKRGEPGESASPYRCEHNLLYWHNANWLGLGPSAASHVAGRRWKNVAHLGQYLAEAPTPPTTDDERLDANGQLGEMMMLGLRTRDGLSRRWLAEALAGDDPRWRAIDQMVSQGLLERDRERVRLSQSGLFVADAVVAELL